jgi:Nucleotidyl transferase AbiEii toxin, Type IV TA system
VRGKPRSGATPLLEADRTVITSFHVALMGLVGEAARAQDVSTLRLDGGTGLAAYYLYHRESEDLDFFADPGLDPGGFGQAVRDLAAGRGVEMTPHGPQTAGMATYEAADPADPSHRVKLQFTVQSPFRLAPLEPAEEGILVASFRDICAGKLHAACDRLAYRDFYDVHVILTRGDNAASEEAILERFRLLLRDLLETDPGLNPSAVGQGLSRVVDRAIVEMIPLRLLIPARSEDIHRTLRVCIAECALQAIGMAPPA